MAGSITPFYNQVNQALGIANQLKIQLATMLRQNEICKTQLLFRYICPRRPKRWYRAKEAIMHDSVNVENQNN